MEDGTTTPTLGITEKPVVTISRKAAPAAKKKPATKKPEPTVKSSQEKPKQVKPKQERVFPTTIMPEAAKKVLDNSEILTAPIFKEGDSLDTMQKNTSTFFKDGTSKLFKRAVEEENVKLDALVNAEYRPIENQADDVTESQLLKGSLNFV